MPPRLKETPGTRKTRDFPHESSQSGQIQRASRHFFIDAVSKKPLLAAHLLGLPGGRRGDAGNCRARPSGASKAPQVRITDAVRGCEERPRKLFDRDLTVREIGGMH